MKKTICELHDEAIKIIRSAIKVKARDYDDVEDAVKDIQWDLDSALDAIEQAKEAGQRMEIRLQEYHDAIAALGFERKKKRLNP